MFEAVAELDDYALASLLASTLVEAGFHPAPIAVSVDAQLAAGVDRAFKVEVPAEESEAATAFLDEIGYGEHIV